MPSNSTPLRHKRHRLRIPNPEKLRPRAHLPNPPRPEKRMRLRLHAKRRRRRQPGREAERRRHAARQLAQAGLGRLAAGRADLMHSNPAQPFDIIAYETAFGLENNCVE